MKLTLIPALLLATAAASAADVSPPETAAPVQLVPTPGAIASPMVPAKDPAVAAIERKFDLQQRAAVAAYIGRAEQVPASASHARSATVYNYEDGGIYVVYAGIERITDIRLQPGETLAGGLAGVQAGDTTRWKLSTVTSGEGADKRQHIIIKPTDVGLVTNMMIPTNKRTYMLDIRSVADWYMPSIRWEYPDDELAQIIAQDHQEATTEQRQTPLAVNPSSLDFDYKIKGRRYAWRPLQVFDDGTHTYIRMPAGLKSTEAPALFVIEDGQPMLVNYRLKGSDGGSAVYIVDRLFKRAELRVGTNDKLTILRHPHWWQ